MVVGPSRTDLSADASVQAGPPVIEPGTTVVLEFTVTPDEMDRFAELSGDDNPLHRDADFARAHGFAGPVVYGALLVAKVSRLLSTRLPGPGCVWHSLTIRFRGPLGVGEPARLTGTVAHWSPDLGVVRLRLAVTAGGRAVADGEVQAALARTSP